MNDELEKLRPEVREAIHDLAIAARLRPEYQQPVGIIRAELLRLADECATLSELLDSARMDRIDEFRHANKIEAELAALKKRIADSHRALIAVAHGNVVSAARLPSAAAIPDELNGWIVRLVVEE